MLIWNILFNQTLKFYSVRKGLMNGIGVWSNDGMIMTGKNRRQKFF
jgi:hypothetical protein